MRVLLDTHAIYWYIEGERGQLARYGWSSHRAYSGQATVPQWLSLDWLGYFGPACRGGLSAACLPERRRQVSAQAGAGRRAKGAARRVYNRQVASCFGDRLPNPFDELRGGLVLAGDGLWERVVRVLLLRCTANGTTRVFSLHVPWQEMTWTEVC